MNARPFEPGIAAWIRRFATRHPAKPAIIFKEEEWTYADMDARVDALARLLAEGGVRMGDRVAVLLHNRPDYLCLFFAAARLGAIFVPLNVRLAPSELQYILSHAEPRAIVSESAFAEQIRQLAQDFPHIMIFDADQPAALSQRALPVRGTDLGTPEPVEFSDEVPVAICYTSGTTGKPKGVVLTHSCVKHMNYSIATDVGLNGQDRTMNVLPLCFTGGLFPSTMPFFNMGCTMILGADASPETMLDLITLHQPSYMAGVPTMFKGMIDHDRFSDTSFESMRFMLSGGAPAPLSIIEAFEARDVAILQGYGLTETTGFNSFLAPEDAITKKGSVGIPFLYSSVQVVDEEGRVCAPGHVGEVLVSGPMVMVEYWRDPEATASAIEDGWLHTGDLGRLDDEGYLYIVDRLKDMIISGGLNVYPAEVENVLYMLGDVTEAAVIGLPDDRWGESVTAVMRMREGSTLTADDVLAHCSTHLADYKRPRQIYMRDTELPKNASGKMLKRELRSEYAR